MWGLRDLLTIKHTPAPITVVAQDSGNMLWQNSASMDTFGGGGLLGETMNLSAAESPEGTVVLFYCSTVVLVSEYR